jgi:hypothetical protein
MLIHRLLENSGFGPEHIAAIYIEANRLRFSLVGV